MYSTVAWDDDDGDNNNTNKLYNGSRGRAMVYSYGFPIVLYTNYNIHHSFT